MELRIALCGISFEGYHLRLEVSVSNIAGAHNGSSRMTLLIKLKLANFFYPKVLQDELSPNSDVNLKLLSDVNHEVVENRKHEFYAANEDLLVPDLGSTLPTSMNCNSRCKLLHGHGHNSIVHTVAKEQVRSCSKFTTNKLQVSGIWMLMRLMRF